MKILENLSGVTELRSEINELVINLRKKSEKIHKNKIELEHLNEQIKELAGIITNQSKQIEKLKEQIRKIGYVNDELGVLEKMINEAKEEETN